MCIQDTQWKHRTQLNEQLPTVDQSVKYQSHHNEWILIEMYLMDTHRKDIQFDLHQVDSHWQHICDILSTHVHLDSAQLDKANKKRFPHQSVQEHMLEMMMESKSVVQKENY